MAVLLYVPSPPFLHPTCLKSACAGVLWAEEAALSLCLWGMDSMLTQHLGESAVPLFIESKGKALVIECQLFHNTELRLVLWALGVPQTVARI